MEEFGVIFRAFLNEAQFTKEMLCLGATQIRKANYASKGLYYEAFTCLSTGFERIGKLCLILDYYIDNAGTLPNFNYMKKEIGHNLTKLYFQASLAAKKHNINFWFENNLDQDIYQRIFRVLSEFALGDRYSNINVLSKSPQQNDPMLSWYQNIDEFIFKNYVSNRNKEKLEVNAKLINTIAGDFMLVHHISEAGETIADVENASWRTGMQELVAPYRQLFILQIIRYWVNLIEQLGDKARDMNSEELFIPYFDEIFRGFLNNDNFLKSRKTWDTI